MDKGFIFIGIYTLSYLLDLCLGDPRWLSHPVIWIGKYIASFEKIFYPKEEKAIWRKRILGALLCLSTLVFTFTLSVAVSSLGLAFICFFLYTTLATKSLAEEGKKVARILASGDMNLARKELSYLVSRDTKELTEEKMIMTTIETISENTVDGVISPMFYAFLGSLFSLSCFGKEISLALPFAMTYKAINTLDSMVGYKNERYFDFGKVSARVDDLANLLPARLTGLLFVPLAALFLSLDAKSAIKIFLRDRKKHGSPNAGQTESSYAGALGIQFGGKIQYFGQDYEKQKIGDKKKEFEVGDILRAVHLLYGTSLVALCLFAIFRYMI